MAVEFDLLDTAGNPITLRLCNSGNRGMITRNVGGLHQYDPRLTGLPIQLGTSLNVVSYGNPVETQPNGGVIQFAIGANENTITTPDTVWDWFSYRWIARPFRVFEGDAEAVADKVVVDVDADMVPVYAGRVSGITHDTLTATVQTTDESILLNRPLVTDFYDATFPAGIQGKPKPYLWGSAYSLAPVLEQEVTQTYRVSARPGGLSGIQISEVRVGGVPWQPVTGVPAQGQWVNNGDGTISLGSPPLGDDVRCDAQQGMFTVSGLIQEICTELAIAIDPIGLATLDNNAPAQASYWSGIQPVNIQTALGDFTNGAGCWWGVNALAQVTGGAWLPPGNTPSYFIDKVEVGSANLNQIQPLAWRIRAGFARNWEPETAFADAVLQAQQEYWSVPAQIFEPHYENPNALTLEPLAVDVPLLPGTTPNAADASATQQRLINAWGANRSIIECTAWMRPDQINLYDTIVVNYMMVTGTFRIIGAIRAIGGGASTLQLWGIVGAIPPLPNSPVVPIGNQAPPPPSVPPPGPPPGEEMGIWTRTSGSGTFTIGVDTPATVTSISVQLVGGGGEGGGAINDGTFFASGGGGGAGGYSQESIAVTTGQSFAWSVGAGGQGAGAGATGNPGSTTTFGGMAGGGGGGGNVSGAPSLNIFGGQGGAASGGTVNIRGGQGGPGFYYQLACSQCAQQVFSAVGGASYFGGGGQPTSGAAFFPGAPGSGGGGQLQTGAQGSPGQAGQIIVMWPG